MYELLLKEHPDYSNHSEVLYKHVDQLLAIPEVSIVDIAYKEVGGKETDQLCISVAVIRKQPRSEVAADHLIPTTLDGVPTDVREANYIERKPRAKVHQ